MCHSFSIQCRVGNGVEWKLKDEKKSKEEEEVEEEQYRGEHLIRFQPPAMPAPTMTELACATLCFRSGASAFGRSSTPLYGS
ncbi:hypothetical protein DAPPUDRAFT_262528 [Daphnia pulex]|uniref:Uncharacterized protein n=1 Tax=Daphnia pulex TaxID=6669 RepID=E9HN54_DAPPU|nr:hypothetical protein DAPPUDRAFT_262528 [Daphnia pulex]|eukprot:EFX66833.1 hypothetical protein DAPPUDRAFT_262528 [Daphnia pulex]